MAESVDRSSPLSDDAAPPSRPFLVAIGASAGGISALQTFFSNVNPQSGTAYVVIVHLPPDHDSHLAEVLQRTAPMPVSQVKGATPIVPDHVYVIPPNKSLGIVDGTLTVAEFTRREQRLAPVDAFFRLLADTHGSRCACVILSGTGTDGSIGLKRIKEYGGLVVAQDPLEAEHADMPRNAIDTGLVDLVLPVSQMPAKIRGYFEGMVHEDQRVFAAAPAATADDPDSVREVLTVLRVRTGHDFSNYKAPTLKRRIERRMALREMSSVAAYARMVRQEPQEALALMQELLISVTNFFRDPQAWSVLQERVIPQLAYNKRSQDQIRVWVAGCATGEEAYSIAMLLCEDAGGGADRPSMQVFATDLDQAAIERAREGLYSEAEVADVSEERLQRFFQREAGGYRVRRDLRELVLFAPHNLIKDPPFSHLDLVSCRNVLIYLNRGIQQRVIETFHFALRPGGYLFLGGWEAPDDPDDLFVRLDADAHIYESRTVTSRLVLPRPAPSTVAMEPYQTRAPEPRPAERIFPADLHHRLLEQYAPPSLIVSESHNIVHMSERVGRYLQLRGGELSGDLFVLARPELRADLRSALHQAARDRTPVDVRGVHVAFDDGEHQVDVRVSPVLREGDPARGFFLVMFDERAGAVEPAPVVALSRPLETATQELHDELARVKMQLRSTIEQYETQAEEAKASNEELQAMNEELRSSAEELETSKEELQSVNEELTTVNQELKAKVDELGSTNNDFHNFINATDIGTIFLDRTLRLKLSTPRARSVFNLLESDVGRPLSDITNTLADDSIYQDVRTVLERLTTVEREVQSRNGQWHQMRVLPYRTADDRIDGVVITFQDITDRRAAELRVRQTDERLRLLIDTALDYAMFTMNDRGDIDSWNPGAQRMFGYTSEEIIGANVSVLFTPEDRARGVHLQELREAAQTGRAGDERYHMRKDGGRIYCSGVTRRLGVTGSGFAKIARDLTPQIQAAEALAQANRDLERRVDQRTGELASSVRELETAKGAMLALLRRLVTAQEDERRRIARDLHDDMGQRVTALRLMLERVGGPLPPKGIGEIEHALALIADLGRDLDFLSWQLRPAVLDELGLAAALPRFIEAWSAHIGVPVEFRFGGYEQGCLSAETELVFYRVAQEALTNVAKHAQATRVDVVLGANDGQAVLVVEDDGIGFDIANEWAAPSAFGLLGMRERAALVGAALHIESSTDGGTAVYLKCRFAAPPDGDPGSA